MGVYPMLPDETCWFLAVDFDKSSWKEDVRAFAETAQRLGLPALVVPAGFGQRGMPIGLQIIGRPFNDETLAALGIAFQGVTDFHTKVPKLT